MVLNGRLFASHHSFVFFNYPKLGNEGDKHARNERTVQTGFVDCGVWL